MLFDVAAKGRVESDSLIAVPGAPPAPGAWECSAATYRSGVAENADE